MVYIDQDGRVYQTRPWNFERLLGLMTGFFAFIKVFFRTLIEPLTALTDGQGSSRSHLGGGSGGGGGGGGNGGNGPPRPPSRRIGRINTLSDCTIPGGGCCGSRCG